MGRVCEHKLGSHPEFVIRTVHFMGVFPKGIWGVHQLFIDSKLLPISYYPFFEPQFPRCKFESSNNGPKNNSSHPLSPSHLRFSSNHELIAVVRKSQVLPQLWVWIAPFFARPTPTPSCQPIFSLSFKIVPSCIPLGEGSLLCAPIETYAPAIRALTM